MKMTTETKGSELIMSRAFQAPKKLVFDAFSDCKHLMKWWGPREWPLNYCKLDFRVGGRWHFCMKGPNPGDEAWGVIIYKEIKAPDRIVYEDYFSDKDGKINQTLPAAVISMDFVEKDGQTTIVSKARYPTEQDLKTVLDMGMVNGMDETLDRLEELLVATAPR
jgi:uncharacterized protein YndB with AHSA1/START domain